MYVYEVYTNGATFPVVYDTEIDALRKAEALTLTDSEGRVWDARWTWMEV